jgi:Lysylphosphatidylglycerol synthase TM region
VKRLTTTHKVALVSLLAGTALFIYLVEKTGPSFIVGNIRLMGSGFLLILLTSGVRHLLRTITWYHCIEQDHRHVGFLDLLRIRLAGESLGDLTFAGPLLGETAKSLAISGRISMAYSFSSIVVENLIFGLSVVLFILSGMLVLLLEFAVPQSVRIAGATLGLVLMMSALAAYVVISRKWMLLTGLANGLTSRGIHWSFLHRRSQKIRLFEENVYGFYGRHRGLFFLILFLDLFASFTGVIEAFVILRITAHQSSLLAAFLLESVNRAVNVFFSFVPLRLGVDEGGAALVLTVLGYGAAAGVSLAIIRKIRAFFWTAVGLLILARYSMTAQRALGVKSSDTLLTSKNEEIDCQRR